MGQLRDVIKMITFLIVYNMIVWFLLFGMLMTRGDTIDWIERCLNNGWTVKARRYLKMHQMCLFSKDIKKLDWFITQEELKLEGNNNV